MQIKPRNIVKGVTPRWKYLGTCEVMSIFTFVLQAIKRQFGKRTINSLSDYSCAELFFHWQPHYTASATRSLFAIFRLNVICQEKDWEIWTLHNFMNFFTCKYRIRAETFP